MWLPLAKKRFYVTVGKRLDFIVQFVDKEKDQHVLDTSMVCEIDQTMKKHVDNALRVLKGVSARLAQLESRTRSLENFVDGLKVTMVNNNENILGEVILDFLSFQIVPFWCKNCT